MKIPKSFRNMGSAVQRISEAGLSRDGYLGFSGKKRVFLFCKRVFDFSHL